MTCANLRLLCLLSLAAHTEFTTCRRAVTSVLAACAGTTAFKLEWMHSCRSQSSPMCSGGPSQNRRRRQQMPTDAAARADSPGTDMHAQGMPPSAARCLCRCCCCYLLMLGGRGRRGSPSGDNLKRLSKWERRFARRCPRKHKMAVPSEHERASSGQYAQCRNARNPHHKCSEICLARILREVCSEQCEPTLQAHTNSNAQT